MDTFANKPAIEVQLVEQGGREQGVSAGHALREKIAIAERRLLEFELFRLQQPWWMPLTLFQYMAQWRARSVLEPKIGMVFPELAQRIAGMAEGAGTSREFLYLFHAMESASTSAAVPEPALAACTAVAARGARTVDRQPLLGHNFDLVDTATPLLTLRECRSRGAFNYLAMSLAPMAGVIDGVNERGLAITYDYVPTTDICVDGPPISLSIDQALSTCSTVTQAVDCISKLPRGGGALLMLADASGDIAALELSANHTALRRPGFEEILSHSNAYQSPEMTPYEVCRTCVYSEEAPQALRGVRVYDSAEQRDTRMHNLLQETRVIDVEAVERILSDHGPDGDPNANTICMHGAHWSTLASVQILPIDRRIRVSYGSACQSDYVDFQL